jgi:hypothetical protein
VGSIAKTVALCLLGVMAVATPVAAQTIPRPSQEHPSAVLVMPFDATDDHTTFMIVSRIGPGLPDGAGLRTHWVFWSADCRHLADLSITLTEKDTVVIDANHIQSQTQFPGVPENVPLGPVVDLKGERGVVIVTAVTPVTASPRQLVGAWTIADQSAFVSFGADAIGFADGVLPDPTPINEGGLVIPTFNPTSLDTSSVIVIGLEEAGGTLQPIRRPSAGLHGTHVCCNSAISDTLENIVSVPDVCFKCALFAPIAPTRVESPDAPLVPVVSSVGAGALHLSACRTASDDGTPAPLGTDERQFLVGFHGQAVGPYGFAASAKYAVAPAPLP